MSKALNPSAPENSCCTHRPPTVGRAWDLLFLQQGYIPSQCQLTLCTAEQGRGERNLLGIRWRLSKKSNRTPRKNATIVPPRYIEECGQSSNCFAQTEASFWGADQMPLRWWTLLKAAWDIVRQSWNHAGEVAGLLMADQFLWSLIQCHPKFKGVLHTQKAETPARYISLPTFQNSVSEGGNQRWWELMERL